MFMKVRIAGTHGITVSTIRVGGNPIKVTPRICYVSSL
jgi:hypothetical protein